KVRRRMGTARAERRRGSQAPCHDVHQRANDSRTAEQEPAEVGKDLTVPARPRRHHVLRMTRACKLASDLARNHLCETEIVLQIVRDLVENRPESPRIYEPVIRQLHQGEWIQLPS